MSGTISNSVGHTMKKSDQIQKLGLSESQMHRFGGVLRTMNLEAIPLLASNVRQSGPHNTGIVSSGTSCASASIPCRIVNLPLCGSFNIVFTLQFDDGFKWMLKVSANGHRFDSVAAAALISEARTMQLLKRETTIPVPKIYAFDASSCNDLNSPFILMERIDGQPLYRGWFDDEIPKARLEHFRVKALQSLAEAMAQLNHFTLTRGGALEFDTTGKPVGLRGAKVVDTIGICNRGTGFENGSEADQDTADHHHHHDGHDDTSENDEIENKENRTDVCGKKKSQNYDNGEDEEDEEDIICEKGPFECPKSAFLFDLDRCDTVCKGDEHTHGCYKALRMFIDLAFSDSNHRAGRFVLTHPDLDVQNVLVGEDGTLRGLIDWDGVASVPREVGCAQYPLWLMRDWVPYNYLYDIQEGRTDEDAGYEESSPAELASYRALYAHFMEKEIERQTGGPDRVTTFGTLPKQEAQLTRRSLVMRDLSLAASSPYLITNIMCHILHQIEQVTEPEWEDLDLDMESRSSCSSENAVDNSLDTHSDTDSLGCEENPETEGTMTPNDTLSRAAADTSENRADGEAAVSRRVLPDTMAKVIDCAPRVPMQDHESQTSSNACTGKAETPEMQQSSNFASNLAPHGWGRRLLCFGCNAAGKGLRRIAKIGYVLEDAVDEVAEILAEAESHHFYNTEHLKERELKQTVDCFGHQQVKRARVLKATETGRYQDIHSTQGIVTPELPEFPSHHATGELGDNLSGYQDTTEPDQIDKVELIQPAIKLQDIPARKAELIKAEKKRRKVNYLAEKGAMKDELQVWEHIAFMVSSHGVSLEQLRMNELKIARWVVDTLQKEKKQGEDSVVDHTAELAEQGAVQLSEESEEIQLGDLLKIAEAKVDVQIGASGATVADVTGSRRLKSKVYKDSMEKPVCPNSNNSIPTVEEIYHEVGSSAAPVTPQPRIDLGLAQDSGTLKQKGVRKAKNKLVGDILPGSGTDDPPSSELSTHTALPNALVLVCQSSIPPSGNESAGKSVPGQKTAFLDNEAVGASAKVKSTPSSPPSRPQSTPEDQSPLEKVSSGLSILCSFGTSCLKKIFSSRKNPEDEKECITPDGSVNDGESDRSGTGEPCQSSATSLSGDEVEVGEHSKDKQDEDDVFGMAAVSASDGERPRKGDIYLSERLGTNQAKKTSSHNDPTFQGGLDKTEGAHKPCLTRKVFDQHGERWQGSGGLKTIPATTDRKTGATDEEKAFHVKPTDDCEDGLDAKRAKDTEIGAEDDDDSESWSEESGSEHEDSGFRDDGEFRSWNIFNLLGRDTLDELRLLRMQEGFLKLLEQY